MFSEKRIQTQEYLVDFTDMEKVTVERMLLWYQHTARQESIGC